MFSHKFTITGFTETWLSGADSELYGPNGYQLIGKHRNSRGGGVAVCVQRHLHYFEIPDISTIESDMETVFIEISKDQLQIDKNILIGVIYRPPATDVRSFNAMLNVYLYKIRKENKICYLLGDFNINLLNHDTHNPTLARKIPNVGKLPKDSLGQMVEESLFLEPVTASEINKLIAGLKNTATGYDDISSTVLKLSEAYITDPLVHICYSSLIEGVFPEQLKIVCVLPLYKAEDPIYFNHYRPVSLLNLLSKVFEGLMYVSLLNFLNKLSIIYEHQFEFRKKPHSTRMPFYL